MMPFRLKSDDNLKSFKTVGVPLQIAFDVAPFV